MSLLELLSADNHDKTLVESRLDDLLRFGSYPIVFDSATDQEKEENLLELTGDYLYKSVLEYQDICNPELIRKLLIALALQIGQEVSLPELGNVVGIDQRKLSR